MAVEQTHTSPSGGLHTGTAPGGKKKNWVEQHKVLAGLGGAAGLILVLGHKGNKSGSSSNAVDPNSAAAAAAAEQAAIDGAVGAATGATGYGTSGGSGTGSATDPGTTPTGTGGSTDPTTGATPTPTSSPNVTINVNNPAPTPQKKAAVAPHKTPGKPHKAPPKHNPHTGTTSKGAGKKVLPKKPAPKHPAPKTKPPTHKPRGSCVVHGRTFEGATAARTGIPQAAPDGTISTPVIVVYGSHTEAHMSHNNGQGWTDNIPGMTPPSRGVPEMRLATQ
jgi:hypothetical protein